MKYNVVLCYHGFTLSRMQAAPFRSPIEDFKNQINYLRSEGYSFVTPAQYVAWFKGTYTPSGPICCVMADDGLSTITVGMQWLIEQQIPFGIAVISRRQRKRLPEDGFASWADIKSLLDSGYCELMYHTHNLHHLTVGDEAGEPQPVLDGPAWLDPGDVVYRDTGDTRMFFDWTFVDGDTWGFPLFGSDPGDSFATPITSDLIFTAKASGTVTRLRLFAALHVPAGAGYDCSVRLRVNGSIVGTFVVSPKNYETRSQWQEREFYSITLPASFNVVAGTQYTLRFETLNSGRGLFRIYAVPDFTQTVPGTYDWRLTTTATSAVEGRVGPDFVDYPQNVIWPARPAIILAFDGGAFATDLQYQGYVAADLAAYQWSLDNRLNSTWTRHRGGYDPGYDVALSNGRELNQIAVLGTYSDGQRVDVRVRYQPGAAFVAETMRMRYVAKQGDRYAAIIDVYRSSGDHNGPWVKIARFASNWYDYHWQEFDLLAPTAFGADNWLRFETQNASPHGMGLMTIYLDARRPVAINLHSQDGNGPGLLYNWFFDYSYDPAEISFYAPQLEGSDIWPIGVNEHSDRGWNWVYPNPPFNIGHAFIDAFSMETGAAAPAVHSVCYPFGSFYQSGDGVLEAKSISAIHPALGDILNAAGITSGFTIWPVRADRESVEREPDLRNTVYTLPRLLVYGNLPPRNVINNIAAYAGMLYEDVQHGGVQWQVSIEPDPAGCATLRRMVNTLEFAAFDAWFFRDDGTILEGELNDGGTYGGIIYADDKNYLQSRGIRCLLIISNYNDDIGDIDPDIASAVVNDPDTYVPLIVAIAVDNAWDGITINLEGIPPGDRAAATAFFVALARALHSVGKLLHCTAPGSTNTDYDADWWVGWCDHGEIVKYVDAMKIMTYSETGDTTEPGSHAPNWFFDAVYDRIDAVIPHEYRRRILVGCNAFGHTWDATGGTFATFHAGMAEGLRRSAYISDSESEATWSAFGNSAWYGAPNTIRRAINKCVDRGYGGIGLWRADTGDLYQHYPSLPWLGRFIRMAFIDERFPLDISAGASGGPNFSTAITSTDGGRESRNIRWDAPLCSFTVALHGLRPSRFEELLAFFRIMRGKGHSFRFKDWSDYKAINQSLGAGDGVKVAFQLLKRYVFGSHSDTRYLTKPVENTVKVYLNGVLQVGGQYVVNYATGVVTFNAPPANGVQVTADCEFDVHARFDTDGMKPDLVLGDIAEWTSIEVVEVRA